MKIGVLGGTGPAGSGLALRLALAGYAVTLGSRDSERSEEVVASLKSRWTTQTATLSPGDNRQAANADVVIVGTVWDASVSTVDALARELAGRVVVSIANGIRRERAGF